MHFMEGADSIGGQSIASHTFVAQACCSGFQADGRPLANGGYRAVLGGLLFPSQGTDRPETLRTAMPAFGASFAFDRAAALIELGSDLPFAYGSSL